jgi:hypothetical protein
MQEGSPVTSPVLELADERRRIGEHPNPLEPGQFLPESHQHQVELVSPE